MSLQTWQAVCCSPEQVCGLVKSLLNHNVKINLLLNRFLKFVFMNQVVKIILTLPFLFVTVTLQATDPDGPKPKLVVGIVVDQMRYDYITRYWNKFGEGGFKKMIREGYNFTNTQFSYIPTHTGAGHASIFTGTTPSVHGITSNYRYDRKLNRVVYVTDDSTVTGAGTSAKAGRMSPVNMLTTTLSDEQYLASNFKSKTIGISIKDRSSILPAGHTAKAAYWFEASSGNFISSSYYMNELPAWVSEFNNRKLPAQLMSEPWNTLYSIESYTESTPDDNMYEDLFPGETRPVFPHNFHELSKNSYEMIYECPFGDVLTREFALAAMKNEMLGKDEYTDFLNISFSAPDYVGHTYGTHSIEIQDTYLRLDLQLAELIKEVELYTGKENVLFFLTADHAAIPNITLLKDHRIPAGIFSVTQLRDTLNRHLAAMYGNQKWMMSFYEDQVYLDHQLITASNIRLTDMVSEIRRFLMQTKGVAGVLTSDDLTRNEYTHGMRALIQNGFYAPRGGDLMIILEPGLVEYGSKGTDHGSGYTYDTHVPLIFYGGQIQKGTTVRQVDVIDIAPTLSQMLGIQPPSGSTGKILTELFGDNK